MESLAIFAVFSLTIVALVALGSRVRGKLDKGGAEISTYPETRANRAAGKKLR